MHIGNFHIDDYIKKSHYSYLGCNPETNVLNAICYEQSDKIDIVKTIVFTVKKREPKYFFTHFHIKWALECLGYAFALPLEYGSTINHAISIYNIWLTDLSKRPPIINENESFYQKEMLAHFTLLFTERPYEHIHVELCAKVLEVIRSVIRRNLLLKENYPYLLKLLLLSFSNILSKNNEFSRKIGGDASRVLFESFIRSEVRDAELWNEIVSRFSYWITNSEFNLSWVSVALGLSKKVLYHLYGEGSELICIEFKNEGAVYIDIPIEHAVLAWNYLVINVLNKTVKGMFDPQTHKEFVRSVSKIVEVFIELSVLRCESKEIATPPQLSRMVSFQQLEKVCLASYTRYQEGFGTFPIPNVTSMVDIFGNWLFNQSRMKRGGTVYGQAEAVGIICRIFSHSAKPIPEAYIGKFYQTLFKHFKNANDSDFQVAGSVLNHAVKILIQDYKGVRILLHRSCIFKVLESYIKSKGIPQQIKRDCYRIISTIIPAMKPYKNHGTISIIHNCLLHAVSAEDESEYIVLLFWSVCSYLMIAEDKEFIESILIALLDKTISGSLENSCFNNCVKVFAAVPFMVFREELIGREVVKEILEKLILPLIKKTVKGSCLETCANLLNLLLYWTMKFPLVLRDYNLKCSIFEALSALNTSKKDDDYAWFIQSFILNYSGRIYPEVRLLYNTTSVITPCFWGNSSLSKVKHFILNKHVLVSVWNTAQGALLAIRNKIGNSIWKFKQVIGNMNIPKPLPLAMQVLKKPKFQRIQNSDPAKVTELIKDLTIGEAITFEKLSRLFKSSIKNSKNFNGSSTSRASKNTERTSPCQTYASSLFSCLGFFNPDLISELSALTDPSAEELIKSLDYLIDNELHTVPLLYLDSPESFDLTKKLESFPRDFISLVESLGLHLTRKSKKLIHSERVQDLIDKYGAVIYNKELYYELAVLVPALFDLNYEVQVDEILAYSRMVIIWNQRSAEPETLKIPLCLKNEIFLKKNVILLTPLRNQIIRVNIAGIDKCEPLIDNMIVPVLMLPKYIAVSLAMNCSYKAKGRSGLQKVEVFKKLEELGRNTEGNGKLHSVLSQFFKD